MKKFLLLYVLASVSLASCVNDESLELTQQPKKLSFEAPVMKTQSRAGEGNVEHHYGEISGISYPTTESFMVFAKQHTGNLTDWKNAANFWGKELPALEVKYNNSESAKYWDTDTDYYWPSDDNIYLSFGAYSPATLNQGATATYTNEGLRIEDFAVNGTVANQVDLMYSGPILNKSYKENAVAGVAVEFKHALSSIVFSAIDADDNANYTINSIKVKGKFLKKGTFCENLSWSNGNATGTAGWSSVSVNDEPTEYALATGLNVTVGTSSTVITEGKSALLTIPHTKDQLDANASVTITYTVTPTNGAPAYNIEKTVNLADFKISENANITSWEIGKRYTYQFSFGGTSKIFFRPTVSEWGNGGTATLTIN